MGSEQRDSTSYQPSEPKLCANNCGFFGSACTENLCSKCYRDSRVKEDRTMSARAAMEKSLHLKSQNSSEHDTQAIIVVPKPQLEASTGSCSSSDPSEPLKTRIRCLSCNKKVGYMGFVCKCSYTFCAKHRPPEKHDCKFDYQGVARDEITKANPVVKADKVERF